MVALLGVVMTPCFYLFNDGFRQQMLLIVPCFQHDIQKKKTNTDNTSNLEKTNRSQGKYNFLWTMNEQ